MDGIVVAKSLRHAVNSATVDWKWKRIAQDKFEAPNGETIKYAPDRYGSLFGFPRSTPVYLGYGWRQRRDVDDICNQIDTGRFVIHEPTQFAYTDLPKCP